VHESEHLTTSRGGTLECIIIISEHESDYPTTNREGTRAVTFFYFMYYIFLFEIEDD
jgi:hypothetical protein